MQLIAPSLLSPSPKDKEEEEEAKPGQAVKGKAFKNKGEEWRRPKILMPRTVSASGAHASGKADIEDEDENPIKPDLEALAIRLEDEAEAEGLIIVGDLLYALELEWEMITEP